MHQAAATLSLSSTTSIRGAFGRPVVRRTSRPAARRCPTRAWLGWFGKKRSDEEEAATGDEYVVTYCSNWWVRRASDAEADAMTTFPCGPEGHRIGTRSFVDPARASHETVHVV